MYFQMRKVLSSASFVQGYYEITIIHGLLCKKKVRHDSTDNIKKITNANRIGAHHVNPVCTCAYELCAAYLSKYSRA